MLQRGPDCFGVYSFCEAVLKNSNGHVCKVSVKGRSVPPTRISQTTAQVAQTSTALEGAVEGLVAQPSGALVFVEVPVVADPYCQFWSRWILGALKRGL